jgi:hypothetical protein
MVETSMRRRRFLAAAGASLVLAGCGSQDSTAGGDPGTDTRRMDRDDFTLGEATDDANPHELRVTNDGDGTRTVTLRITGSGTTETLLDRSFSLGVDGEISGELRGPATYEVRVTVPDAETEHLTTVDYFDTCNDYGTTVTIDASGSMTSQMFRTDAMCPSLPTETSPPETTPLDGFALGETTGEVNPHGLTLRNDGDDSRTGRLRVADADETLLNRSFSLGVDDEISGELRGPATYEVRVTVSGSGAEHTTAVEYFDTCNSYGTTVTIDVDGAISSETLRTLIACDP